MLHQKFFEPDFFADYMNIKSFMKIKFENFWFIGVVYICKTKIHRCQKIHFCKNILP